jgi:hypothetical protein
MRKIGVILLGVALALTACGGGDEPASRPDSGATGGTPGGKEQGTERTAAVYAAVIRRLMTKDHTFGGGDPPFERIFVFDGAVERAANPTILPSGAVEPFDPELQSAIARRLADLSPLEFVSDPGSVVVGRNRCARVFGNGVLVTLGPIVGAATGVTVSNSLFFACLGGQWLTYVLEGEGDDWRVVGTKGPVAIS